MSKAAFSSLHLSAFRGASEPFTLDFDAKTRLTIIYGENGTGKTTICDAFDFLATGKVGSLVGKGIDSGTHKYWHSANKQPADLLIELADTSGTKWTGKMNGSNANVLPLANRLRLALMRRKQMLDLVEAKEGDRYKEISRFVDTADFEKSELTLKTLLTDLGKEKQVALNAQTETHTTLSEAHQAAGATGQTDPIGWARALIATSQKDEAEELAAIEELVGQYQALVAYPVQMQQRKDAVVLADIEFKTTQDAMTIASSDAATNAAELVDVLNAGQTYLHTHADSEVCPLCESGENADGLLDAIKARLGQFAAINEAKINLDKCQSTLSSAQGNLALTETGYAENLISYQAARNAFAWDSKYSFPESAPPHPISDLQTWLDGNNDLLEKWKNIEAGLRNSSKERISVTSTLKRYDENKDKVTKLDQLTPRVELVHSIMKTKRREFTDTILLEISEKAGELYEMVHPGEGKNKVSLLINQAQRASVELKAEFSGKDAPPQAYLSQSHIDTLGLCIFLALAMRETPAEQVLILDDVLGSVDEPHVDRLIDMIYAVTKEFRHTLVTTHYGPWRHKYRWGMIKPGQPCQFIELQNSGEEDKITTFGSIPEIEWLRQRLNEQQKDMQGIVSKAGVILEATLDFVTQHYHCAVPRKSRGDYTLGDLLPSVNGRLREQLRVEFIVTDLSGSTVTKSVNFKPELEALMEIMHIRNLVGAHFNTLSFEMLDADALKFARHVETLADALICTEHGWPTKNKTGNYLQNGGDTRRLYPIIKPN